MWCYFFDGFEWYTYSYVVPYISVAVFQGHDTSAWLAWGVPFFIAPIGGILFGHVGDFCGRKVSTVAAGCGLVVGTMGQGLTPVFSAWSVPWLLFFRAVQGISYGGKLSIGDVYLCEAAGPTITAMSRVVAVIPWHMGFLALSLIVLPLEKALSLPQMQRWGWRIPFITSSLLSCVSLTYFAIHAKESPAFQKHLFNEVDELESKAQEDPDVVGQDATQNASVVPQNSVSTAAFVQRTWKQGVLLIGGMTMEFAYQALAYNFLKNWMSQYCGLSPLYAGVLNLGAQVLTMPGCIFGLYLADTIGLQMVGAMASGYGIILSLPLYLAPYSSPSNAFIVVGIESLGLGVMLSLTMCLKIWCCDLFPVEVRGRGTGLYTTIAFLNAGVAPAICTGYWLAPALYLLAASGVSFVSFLLCILSHRNYAAEKGEDQFWVKVSYARDKLD